MFEKDVFSPGRISGLSDKKIVYVSRERNKTVQDLKKLTNEQKIKSLAKSLPRIGVKSLKKWIKDVNKGLPGKAQGIVNNIKVEHPYKSLHLTSCED